MNLTNEEIKALIRKSQGWTELKEGPNQYGWKLGEEWHYLNHVPNYPESLDACAEFEKDAPRQYWRELATAVTEPVDSSPISLAIAVSKATPLQRCIAFLRAKGLIQ